MCGIVGLATLTPVSDRNLLLAGRDALYHRGPDDAGVWWSADGRIGLGHRRLSIIDLSPAGHQPMLGPADESVIVFNGEIYNYRELRSELLAMGHIFRSHSDTEVILAAWREWGTECLARLNGAFAFALYDLQKQQIFLARDRAGEKPLYYSVNANGLAFASEIKGLLKMGSVSARIDPLALDCYLATGYVPGKQCMIQGVQKLLPAQAMIFDTRTAGVRLWHYWTLPDFQEAEPNRENDKPLLDELEGLLQDAVGRQMVADVPVGILLSGGVDSSLLTAMAVRTSNRVKTFTIRLPGHAKYDETEYARLISRYFGTEHVELEASDTTVDLLPDLARQFDEPLADSSMIPTHLISQLIRKHCTVAIGGDGGDELFGGYSHYDHVLHLQQDFRKLPRFIRSGMASAAEGLLPVGLRGRNHLRSYGMKPGSALLPVALFDKASRRKLFRQQADWALRAEQERDTANGFHSDLIQQATRFDFYNYLPEDILVKVDRASMLNSLEVRAPFLDYRLIDFAFGKVPTRLKTTLNQRKIMLKLLAKRVLPAEFDLQRKQGFSIPLAAWLESSAYSDFFGDVLLGSDNPIFDRRFITTLLDGQKKGRSNSERLFSLIMFELWRKEYGVSL